MKYFTLNQVFAAWLVVFVAVIAGFVPREVALYAAAALIAWSVLTPLEKATLFFVRSVPLFIALPLTTSYDNLTMWRPLAIVLFIRWFLQPETRQQLKQFVHLKQHPVFRRMALLFVIAALSLLVATHPLTGAIRIIYFANLLMVPVILWSLLNRKILNTEQVIHTIAIPTVVVIVVGFLQLISTYLMDIYQFMRLWGEGIQLRQFGTEWSYIAVNQGNTWLAYYGPQLSLRAFSLFTDSHTFPIFVLLGLPALFAIALKPILAVADRGIKAMIHTRARMTVLWIPAAFLIIILSGTRGIWAASIGVVMLAVVLARFIKKSIFTYVSLYLAIFFMLFAVAWPIFISPQFLVGKADWGILGNRVRSIIDFGETSNALRIKIWEASLNSVAQHPLLGVGIGNYPIVLDQDIALARAGSTAHNVYLHVAAEMGIIAALEFIILLGGVFFAAWRWTRTAQGMSLIYASTALLAVPWVYLYLLTDAALFDERAFLMFGFTAALICAHDA